MDVADGFLRAVHEAPHDDTPWLVLADWLEERGDPRAELVRLRLALCGPTRDAEAPARERRACALIAAGVRPVVAERTSSLGMRLALIPPGFFDMGSPAEEDGRYADEGPQHVVAISRPFYLGVFLVTQGEYEQVTGANPSHFSGRGDGRDMVAGLDTRSFPVERISWEDAKAFCDRLSALPAEKAAGRVYRLPTEAEWEYACRAGTTTPFHLGPSLSALQANFNGGQPYGGADEGPYLRRTTAVGSYLPNLFGLYDMHGNVYEWCADRFSEGYYRRSPRRNPHGPAGGGSRVLRSGSWADAGRAVRAALRCSGTPSHASLYLGMRVALTWRGG